jgi:ketosteroid isomerase-like protein
VMSLFAPDAILSYPGMPDSGYDAIRQIFEKNYSKSDIQGTYSADIQEVQVAGDLAFVRAVWSADLEQKSTGLKLRSQDKDLEIWRCQPGGSWKLYRGLSFPIESPKKAGTVAGS